MQHSCWWASKQESVRSHQHGLAMNHSVDVRKSIPPPCPHTHTCTSLMNISCLYTIIHAAVNCPNLVSPANGRVEQGGNTFGDTAAYICDEGFRVSGTIIRTCLADGQWSGTASTCERKTPLNVVHVHVHSDNNIKENNFSSAVNCGDLPAPDNGRVIFLDGTVFGSVVTYECNAGFNLVGIAIRSCEADGNWSGIDPTCESKHPIKLKFSLYFRSLSSHAFSCSVWFTTSSIWWYCQSHWHYFWFRSHLQLPKWVHFSR